MRSTLKEYVKASLSQKAIPIGMIIILTGGPASSTDFLDKLQDKAKATSGSVSNTLSKGTDNVNAILTKSVAGVEDIVSIATTEAGTILNNFMKDFEDSRWIFNDAGFYITSATVYASIPPSINVTFRNGKLLSPGEYNKINQKLSGKPVMKALLNTLVSFTKINSGDYAVSKTTIKIGLPPSAYAIIPLDKK